MRYLLIENDYNSIWGIGLSLKDDKLWTENSWKEQIDCEKSLKKLRWVLYSVIYILISWNKVKFIFIKLLSEFEKAQLYAEFLLYLTA